jgi:serine/threonine-protein kinase
MEPLAPEDLVDDWSDLSTSSLGVGARLGRYELLLPVAYGGMARVWAARLVGQRGFSKVVAIKTILPHLAHNAEFERMFLDEARIASGVHHPNVVEIYELGEEGHVLYLAMEWVNGESLVHVVRGLTGKNVAALDPRIASRIAADACAGLHSAHELVDEEGHKLNVVHRDVSPHNILVSVEGTVKVMDFGVAKAIGQSHQATVAGQIKGKVAYMAPEVIASNLVDRRGDVFAMGCVLYEMTTGRLPFRGGNDPQVMQAVLKGAYDPPPTIVRGFPLELAGIIDRALASDAKKRFATAEEMRMALEEWIARTGPMIPPSEVGRVVRQRVGAHVDQRRDHVRAAMAGAQEGDRGGGGGMRPAAGQTPSVLVQGRGPSSPGQSHSGVVVTVPELPREVTPPPTIPAPPPGMIASPPSGPLGPQFAAAMAPPAPVLPAGPPILPTLPIMTPMLPIVQPAPRASGGGSRYVVAAIAGVVFAVAVGGVALLAWNWAHPRALDAVAPTVQSFRAAVAATAPPVQPAASAARAPAPAPQAAAPGAPPLAPAGPASAPASQPPEPAPQASASASSGASPTTVNVNDLPAARPAWMDQPAPVARGPVPAASSKPPALPANPY